MNSRHLLQVFLFATLVLATVSCDTSITPELEEFQEEAVSKRPGTEPVCHVSKSRQAKQAVIKLIFVPPERARRLIGLNCIRDLCDYDPIAAGASGDERRDRNHNGIADGCEIPTTRGEHGKLANPGYENRAMKSVFFFAGNWRNEVQFYEYNPTSNIGLYTQHPTDARHLGWSESKANRIFAVDRMVEAGVNVINMSNWGPRRTDNWAYWAPMQTAIGAQNELFDVAAARDILIAPYIESYAATDHSPPFIFADVFPGSAFDPAPELVARIEDLLQRYLKRPKSPKWPHQWAQMYDKDGHKRYVISLIHVASNQSGVTNTSFAEGFDRVAARVFKDTGIRVGFTLDMLPWDSGAAGVFKPQPEAIAPLLLQQSSILAIQCFIPEIFMGSSDDVYLAHWKRAFSARWIRTGIPFIQDVSPGYDAHIVFPGAPLYGNNVFWRNRQIEMVQDPRIAGVTINTWNGYTEGFASIPTLEQGAENWNWMTLVFSTVP